MAGSNPSAASPAPKILLAKPSLGPLPGKFGRVLSEDETAPHRSRLPPVGSLNLLSDSWDFHSDRFLPFLTENTDFTVVGVIGPTGVGKSTILNEIYGFDGSSPGMLPPFAIQSEEIRAMAKHCTVGIEPRVSAERFILLDTQPVFSPSVLAEMIKSDGSSMVPVLVGESLPAELAHELMSIQVDLLKHGIPDPSTPALSRLQTFDLGHEKEFKDKIAEGEEYMATPIFVHTKLQDQDLTPQNIVQLRKALSHYFKSHSFLRGRSEPDSTLPTFVVPSKNSKMQQESCISALWKLRNQVLSMQRPSFSRPVSEREWLKNSAKIWEVVKSSAVIAEYRRVLQSSGLFRR